MELLERSKEDEVIPGWLGKPKGLLQKIWEHGWIDMMKASRSIQKKKENTG